MAGLDTAVLIQISASAGVFLAFWKLVGERVFREYFEMLEAREESSIGAVEKAKDLAVQITNINEKVQDNIREARITGVKARDEIVAAAKSARQTEIDRVLSEVTQRIEEEKTKVEIAQREADKDVPKEAEFLASKVVERLFSTESRKVVH